MSRSEIAKQAEEQGWCTAEDGFTPAGEARAAFEQAVNRGYSKTPLAELCLPQPRYRVVQGRKR